MASVIFIFEDNQADEDLIRMALARHKPDCLIFSACDGGLAELLLRRAGGDIPVPDAIVMDLNLPKIEGTELFELIRSYSVTAEVPIIVCTSAPLRRDEDWALSSGAAAYFRKPSTFAEYLELGKVVRGVLDAQTAS